MAALPGKRVCYYPRGKKFSEMTFVKGLAEGETTIWHEDGTVASTDQIQQGRPDRIQMACYRNGKKSNETPLVQGVTNGTCRLYLSDSRLFGLSVFDNGIEVGRRVIIEPTEAEYKEVLDACQFSACLKDHWPAIRDSDAEQPGDREIRQGNLVEVEWKENWYRNVDCLTS